MEWSKLRKVPLFFMASSILLAAGQMISGVIVVKWINPGDLGLWHSFRLMLVYSFLLLGGMVNGLSRELPFYLGSDDKTGAERLASSALWATAFGSLLVLIAGILSSVLFHHKNHNFRLGVYAVTILIIFAFYKNYLIVTFRSKSSFNRLAVAQMVEAVLMLATIPLVYYLLYDGMMLRLVAVGGISLFVLHLARPFKIVPHWDTKSLSVLLKTGIPIFILDYLYSSSNTFDRIVLLKMGGVVQVGYYALAATAYDAFSAIPIAAAQYLYPRMTYSFGKNNDGKILWRMVSHSTILLLVAMVPFACVGWYLLPPVVERFFPHYRSGIEAARILLFAAIPSGAAIGVNALWSMKAWKWIISYQLCRSGLLLVGPFLGAMFCSSLLVGVAYGVLWARLLGAFIGLLMTFIATHESTGNENPTKLETPLDGWVVDGKTT